MRLLIVLLITTLKLTIVYAQIDLPIESTPSSSEINLSSKKSKALQKALVAPLVLTGLGLYATTNNHLLNRIEWREERNEWMPNFNHHADDYLQYAPIVAVYSLSLAGVKSENNFANRTVLLIKSEAIMAVMVFSLKKITAVPRPDTGAPDSFPSGHTAQAFAAATFMHKEYGKQNIWYSIGAYSLATGIGAFRIMNNRHWVSDVLVGAGIGIFSTNMAYLTHQNHWGKKKSKHQIMAVPTYGHGPGVYLSYRF